jgi:glycosyltransferase involved in cell wall biosynthesis
MLSVVIIARDEERHIAEAIRSAQPVAEEVVVLVDTRTVDRTREIATKAGALSYDERFRSHAAQRNRALRYCSQPWVLFLDADERLTDELVDELQGLQLDAGGDRTQPAGFWIPRYNLYWGRRLRGGGWYPDRQLRLLRREAARFDERRLIHEYAELDGPAGGLNGHLLHINIESLAELREKQYFYAVKEAETLHQQGQRARPRNLVLQPLREVKRRFWTWKGYRDGALGLFLALMMGYYEWVKYVKLYALQRSLAAKAAPIV